MRNIQSLATEMFRDSRDLSQPFMNDVFTQKNNSRYNLKQVSKLSRPLVKSVYHGSNGVSFLGPKLWTCCQMIAMILTTQILLRIKLRNRNLKIALAGSVKFT